MDGLALRAEDAAYKTQSRRLSGWAGSESRGCCLQDTEQEAEWMGWLSEQRMLSTRHRAGG